MCRSGAPRFRASWSNGPRCRPDRWIEPLQRALGPKLEAAILEHLGQYSDPEKVRSLLAASAKQEVRQQEAELRQIQRRLTALDRDFHQNLALLKRGLLNEEEFHKANVARRQDRARDEARRAEVAQWLAQERDRQEALDTLPQRVGSFLQDVLAMDTRRAKALLQTILKAAHVYRDDRIELEFRT